MSDFHFTEKNRDNRTQHRLWIGPLVDPDGHLGIMVGTQHRTHYDGAEDVALPLSAIPSLIAYLSQFVVATPDPGDRPDLGEE